VNEFFLSVHERIFPLNLRFVRGSAFIAACLAVSVLATAACGATSIKPLTATDVVQKAQTSSLKDTAFDLKLDVVASGVTISFTGTGKLTQSPERSEINLHGSFLGQSIQVDDITAGGFDYTKTTPSKTTKYVKTASGTGSSLGVGGGTITSFGNLHSPTLVGIETVNGHQVYHLRGTLVAPTPAATSSTDTPTTEDLWVRTDNFYPAKVMISSTSTSAGATSTATATITFTSWNTGLTITIPPAKDVVSG
jgi:hypothetical protein